MFYKCATVTTYLKAYITISCMFIFVVTTAAGLILIISPEEPSLELGGGSYYSLYSGIALLTLSVITLLLSVGGCICVNRDSKYGLCLYAVLSVIIAILIVGSASVLFGFTYSGIVSSKLNSTLWTHLQSTGKDNDTTFFGIQSNYSCCGVNDPYDWLNKDIIWSSNDTLPTSCCNNEEERNCTLSESFTKGCNEVLMERLKLVVDGSFGAAVIGTILLLITAVFMTYGSLLIRKYQSYDIL